MKIKGRVWKFGNNINTDDIISAKYLVTTDEKELGKHCLEDKDKRFTQRVSPGDIIVAGKNFGCGSSREHAVLAIKGCGVSCIIARSFAMIFYRNAINSGLPILECSQAWKIKQDNFIKIDLDKGIIENITQNERYKLQVFPIFLQKIIKSGGLIEWVKKSYNIKEKSKYCKIQNKSKIPNPKKGKSALQVPS